MITIWVVTIILSVPPTGNTNKFFMLDGHAYASRGLCEMAGVTKIGDATSVCEEIPVRQSN